jgi:hypothetical protein
MKKCVKCGALLPESKFNKHKAAKDGLQSWCRDCQKNYNDMYEQRKKPASAKSNYRGLLLELQFLQNTGQEITHLNKLQNKYRCSHFAQNLIPDMAGQLITDDFVDNFVKLLSEKKRTSFRKDENIHKKLDRIISLLENINQSPL